jgi:hypothetical protein
MATTYDFANQDNVLAADHEDAARYVAKFLAHVYPLDGVVQNNVGCGAMGNSGACGCGYVERRTAATGFVVIGCGQQSMGQQSRKQ